MGWSPASYSAILSRLREIGENALVERAPPPRVIKDHSVGKWENKYKDDPNLFAVYVHQFPTPLSDQPAYEGRHPAMIIYVFNDGRANQIGFDPVGKLQEDFWYHVDPISWVEEHKNRPHSALLTFPESQP